MCPMYPKGSSGAERELSVGICDVSELYFFIQIGLMRKIPIFCKESTAGGKVKNTGKIDKNRELGEGAGAGAGVPVSSGCVAKPFVGERILGGPERD